MSRQIEKALIPIAGMGTRLRPLTAAMPKALFPLGDESGRVRPVLHHILAEAAAAGVGQVGLIVSPDQQAPVRAYLQAARDVDDDLPERVEMICQPEPEGFGEAVLRGAGFIADAQAFMLLLGDHVYRPGDGAPPCAAQIAAAMEEHDGVAMIGMQCVDADELPRVGTAAGEPAGERVYRCTDFVEKPDVVTARKRLRTPGLGDDEYLAHCGIYAFTGEIFDCLGELADRPRAGDEEVQLADAQSMLLARHAGDYYLYRIDGEALDTGTPANYLRAFARMGES